ncbi:MAG: hypothetical protein RL031_163 [Actinomycetota bacterium]|jgi:hypothetical protein
MSSEDNAQTLGSTQSASDSSLVEEVKVELNDIDNSDLTEHAARFDALHGKLQEALNSIDGL